MMYPQKKETDEVAHIGVGDPPVHAEERSGTTCDDCAAYSYEKRVALRDNYEEHWAGIGFMSVPGGASGARMGGLTPLQSERKFQKDMDSYKASKTAGLQPDTTTVAGVERAEKRAESFTRVERDADRGRYELSDRAVNLIRSAQGGTDRLRRTN